MGAGNLLFDTLLGHDEHNPRASANLTGFTGNLDRRNSLRSDQPLNERQTVI